MGTEIQQNSLSSNSIPFTVNTAAITNVSPANGLPGTQVTLTGSGFGASQASGMVWLGTAVGAVTSWSDSQVVATVAVGSTSGNARILQNGVWSNSVAFTIDSLQIANITPNSGAPGTVVTINGGGFGNSQASGSVIIGGVAASVVGWGDTQVVVSVGSNAVSGVAGIQQNGVWSNTVTFTVPPAISGGSSVTLMPNAMSMIVGDTRSVQALDANGLPVTGLAWTSSDTTVATLTTDDPPVITAVAPGHITISAGVASAVLDVFAGPTLPLGTKIWSNPGDGSGVSQIMPAVPSSTGVADVFALQSSGNVQAIKSDGTVAWTSNVSNGQIFLPDFQGGLVVASSLSASLPYVKKLDGLTGTAYPPYNYVAPSGLVVVHTDGTIFTVDNNAIVGIDPMPGQQKFTVPLEQSVSSGNGDCGEYTPSQTNGPATVGQPIIAGDGYAYFPYVYTLKPLASNEALCPLDGSAIHIETHSRVMRVGTDGSSSEIAVQDWLLEGQVIAYVGSWYTGTLPGNVLGTLITNADQGALYSWAESPYGTPLFHLTNLTNGSATTVTTGVGYQGNQGAISVQPVLQRADGSYVGKLYTDAGYEMVAFTSSGNTLWIVPNDSPQIATSDGGVIGASGITYDQNGNQTGQLANLPTLSWPGDSYQLGSTEQIVGAALSLADASFWSQSGSNPSQNGTAVQRCAPLESTKSSYLNNSYSSLISFLIGQYCAFCNASIFQQLSTSQAEFTAYLQQGHEFCDGSKSTEPGGSIGATQTTVAAYFQAYAETEAVTVATGKKTFPALGGLFTFSSSERKKLRIYFAPTLVTNDPPFNESMLFHESLHGFSGLSDGGVPGKIGLCDVLGSTPQTKIIVEYPNCGTVTISITDWIEENIIAPH